MSLFGGGALGAAASIFIDIGVNSDAAKKGLMSASQSMAGFKGQTQAWGQAVAGAFRGPLDAFGQIGDAADGMKSVMGAVAGLAQTLFSGAARNEQYAVSFEVMMGSADKAREHITALKDFAATTPFTLPGIVEASKQLEVMGGSTLNTMENMRLVGNVASGTGADIRAVGVQFGRMYDAMANGTPLGEVIMRLGEMGALSGESRRAIQGLAAQVSAGTLTMEEAWQGAGSEFARFAGMTEKQSLTLAGLWSTFTDTIDDSFAQIGTKLMPMVKPVMTAMIDLVGQLAIGGLWLADNIELLVPVIVSLLVPAVALATMWFASMAVAVLAATWPFLAIGLSVAAFLQILKMFGIEFDDIFRMVGELVDSVAKGFAAFIQIIQDVIGGVTSLMDSFGFLIPPLKIVQIGLGALGDAFGLFKEEAKQTSVAATVATHHMAQAMSDDFGLIKVEVAEAAEGMFEPWVSAAKSRGELVAFEVRMATRNILDTFKAARDKVSGVADELAGALYDPLILKGDLALVRVQLRDKKLLAALKTGSKAEMAEAGKKYAELQAQELKLLALQTTYGTQKQQLAKTQALLTGTNWAKGLRAGTPEQDAALLAWKKTLEDRLAELSPIANEGGKKAGKAAGKGMKDGLPGNAEVGGWADNMAETFGRKLAAGAHYARDGARTYMEGARGMMEFDSPAKEGPFRYIDDWGVTAGRTFADSLASAGDYLSTQAGRFMSGGLGLASAQPVKAPAGGGAMAPPPGGGLIVNMEFNSAVPYTPGEMEQLGRRVGPAVYEYLRQRGLAIS